MPTRCPIQKQWRPKDATALLSQQIWCWGRDIVRPEGNWLLEVGFQRIEPPANRPHCPSLYRLELPGGRCVLLRGFGVFYGDVVYGGIFLTRYSFRPRYTTCSELDRPPWTLEDLPEMRKPDASCVKASTSLVLGLLDWIRHYEMGVLEQLGASYRQDTLRAWDNGKQPVIPAEEIASAWHELSLRYESGPDTIHSTS